MTDNFEEGIKKGKMASGSEHTELPMWYFKFIACMSASGCFRIQCLKKQSQLA
jgi:hypothetical protein